jgi:hypothetical protein
MELYALSTAVLGTANSSLGKAFTNYCYSKWMGWRLKKRLHAVVLLKGVSTLCQKFSSVDVLFLDVDVLFEQLTAPKEASDIGKKPTVLESFMAYPIIRNHLYSVSRVFKKNIVCVSHSHELLQALSISSDNTWFYAFSREMDERTLPLFNGSETLHAESVVNKLRTRDRFEESKIVVVESMADLESKIKLKFGILQTEI